MLILVIINLPEWVPYVAGVMVVVGAIWGVQEMFARKRTQALTAVAMEIGFNFEGETWRDEKQAPYVGMALFKKGHSQKFCNIMTGSAAGLRVSLFDYSFTTGGGKSSHTYSQTVAAFSKAGISLPEFAMQPEGVLQKIGNVLTHKDINFDSHPEFSRRCHLRSPDEERTRVVFTPALLSYFEGLDRRKKWRVEGLDDCLIIYRLDKKTKPQDFRAFLEETTGMANSFFTLCGLKKAAF
ncbi:MAG: hypothetical protein JST79_07535 [Acidobacteria bacterium]|nr:hypothetical protein [Acidobacteriota bacterium]